MMTEDDERPIVFIFGDDYGDIETKVLGSHQGTTTRQMNIPRRLAKELYEELGVELKKPTKKYLVYGFEDGRIANVAVVESNTKDDAIEKAKEKAAWMGYRVRAVDLNEYPNFSDIWAAVN